MSAPVFSEITTGDDRRQGRRVFRHEGACETLVVTVDSSIDLSPLADGTGFRPDPNGLSNREAGEALVGLAAQMFRSAIGHQLPAAKS